MVFERSAMDCEQGREPRIGNLNIFDQKIMAMLNK
jgi:hypothetical protein